VKRFITYILAKDGRLTGSCSVTFVYTYRTSGEHNLQISENEELYL